MTRALLFLTISALAATSCSQSERNVPFYHYGVKPSGGSLGIHTFHSSETLWSISNAYRVELRELLDVNSLSAPYRIKVGQRLKIPAPSQYKARQGDTIYKVSRMFDTTTTEIVRLNNLKKPYVLRAGQNLRLPSQNKGADGIQMASYQIGSPQKVGLVEREELPPTIRKEKFSEDKASTEKIVPYVTDKNTKVSFIKPVSGKIISGFGPKADGLHNDGINIKASRGDAVRAAESGVIVYNGQQIEGYGNMVLIRHANGYLTAYAHMDKILIKNGDKVKRGQTIGTVGSTGNVKIPQLHFEIRKGRDALNPQSILGV